MPNENIPATLDKLKVSVDEIHPRKNNPRRGDVDAIAESLERNGQYRAIVVNRATGEILAGNHTYAAAKRLGWRNIAATFVDVDEDAAARIVLADNRTGDLGHYDDDLLVDLLRSLADGDLTGTGYDQDDLGALAHLGESAALDLDDLADKYGDLTDEDTWPTVKFQAPQHVAAAWSEHMRPFDTEYEALAALLDVPADGKP